MYRIKVSSKTSTIELSNIQMYEIIKNPNRVLYLDHGHILNPTTRSDFS